MGRRQESGEDRRGNAKDRKARKLYLLNRYGNGVTAPCVHCGEQLTFETMQADRIIPGGSYRRENVQPSCARDNRDRGNKIDWVPPRLRNLRRADFALFGVS